MIACRDFIPEHAGSFFRKAERYAEKFAVALAEANNWIGREKIDILNVETIAFGESMGPFIRVWFRVTPGKPVPTPEI